MVSGGFRGGPFLDQTEARRGEKLFFGDHPGTGGGLDWALLLDLKRHFSHFITLLFCFKDEYVFAFKQARRREDDIAIVNTGMRVLLEKQGNVSSWKIKDCSFSFGGMAPTTVMALKTIKGLTGR